MTVEIVPGPVIAGGRPGISVTGGDLHVRQWNPAAPQGMNAPSSMRSSPRVADSVLITTWHDSPDEIDSGHLPALSHPKELANRILAYLAES